MSRTKKNNEITEEEIVSEVLRLYEIYKREQLPPPGYITINQFAKSKHLPRTSAKYALDRLVASGKMSIVVRGEGFSTRRYYRPREIQRPV